MQLYVPFFPGGGRRGRRKVEVGGGTSDGEDIKEKKRGKRRSPRLGVSSSCIPYLSTLFNPPPSAPVDCRLITHV